MYSKYNYSILIINISLTPSAFYFLYCLFYDYLYDVMSYDILRKFSSYYGSLFLQLDKTNKKGNCDFLSQFSFFSLTIWAFYFSELQDISQSSEKGRS